jgi:hypothetical protein
MTSSGGAGVAGLKQVMPFVTVASFCNLFGPTREYKCGSRYFRVRIESP